MILMTVAVKNYFTGTKMGNHKSQVSFHSFENLNLPIEKFTSWEDLGTKKVHLNVPSFCQAEFISRKATAICGTVGEKGYWQQTLNL